MKQFSQSRYKPLVVIEWECAFENVADSEGALRVCFITTSFPVSYYIGDKNYLAARDFMERGENELITTEIVKRDFEKAFGQSNESHKKQSARWKHKARMRPSFGLDCSAKVITVLPLEPGALQLKLEELNSRYTKIDSAVSFDDIHVASALLLKADLFLSFDPLQRKLAKWAGLNVWEPF